MNGQDPDEPTPKKRKKGTKNDSDYRPPTQRKVRKQNKADIIVHRDSPLGHFVASGEDEPPKPSQSDHCSSDLEDCEEIWVAELNGYVSETHKRYRQVELWFNASAGERTSTIAQRLSHHYSQRIARIPEPPPSPMPSQHVDEYMYPADGSEYALQGDGDSHYGAIDESDEPGLDYRQTQTEHRARGTKGKEKRSAPGAPTDTGDEFDVPKGGPATKKRKLQADAFENGGEYGQAMDVDQGSLSTTSKAKGKGKQLAAREQSIDTVSSTPKGRKRPGQRKKTGGDLELVESNPPSVVGDTTPLPSRPTSPVPVNTSVIFELDEVIQPLKKAKKMDDAAMLKRVKTLEEAQRKVWTNIARRDVAKVYKYRALGQSARQLQCERIAKLASLQARRPFTKTAKSTKDTQAKAKRLVREMQAFWKKNEREERDVRKKELKEAMDRMKVEEERREAARQARKLEFLISQTELYSHFVGNKLKTAEVEGEAQPAAVPAGAEETDVSPDALRDIDFDDDDQTNLYRHARHNAQEAIAMARKRAEQFDEQAALERKTNEAIKLAKEQGYAPPAATDPSAAIDSDELNFQNPTSLTGITIGQPKMLMAELKEYQLKGLNWLATLYEQGINGILADEMGLGKTVQSISLLSYLAETHDIWGPFLVVAPASTLHNWQQEITRFVPALKALPYWGNPKDRATLRKFWMKKEISYNQDAPFHVLITSYQMVTQDQQYFQRVKWQYMILDEAQNIKNSASVRWKTLLGFHCRNRLLLTGTPIQNSMQELWALLHFIMPSLFDSHDEFNEWFSKDIENAAENKGGKLNEHQLRRLHMILKPFMLRRVKRHVQNELSEKIEIDIYVDLSARQRNLYRALLANVSVADLLEKAANIGDVESARSLMNLVMQFRKVCNHPELFERADVVAPFSFAHFGRSGPLGREGDVVNFSYSSQNPIQFSIPELFYRDGGLINVPYENSTSSQQSSCLSRLMNIWSTDYIYKSIYEEEASAFSFLRILDMSPQEAHSLHVSPLIRRTLSASQTEIKLIEELPYIGLSSIPSNSNNSMVIHPTTFGLDRAEGLPELCDISRSAWNQTCLSRPELKWYTPRAVAPAIPLYCTDRTFLDAQSNLLDAPLESLALYGMPSSLKDSESAVESYHSLLPGVPPDGLLGASPHDQIPLSKMQVPEAKRLIYDSAKLARLDSLLQELKAGDHRVLVYFQMTRMMDLMEEYLVYRQYKYLRLDGSSKIEDRRDMVMDWQTRPDIFIFLLSTRAGGLGINLTAADTVVFYDHDWNPSNDAQAMDRAHRLGQTRQVTVYRLITKGTIDERIVQLARVKKDVQDIVVGNKTLTDSAKPAEIVQLLLNDEQLANLQSNGTPNGAPAMGDRPATESVRDLWVEEGDDFFGGQPGSGAATGADTPEDGQSGRGKKKKPAARGRKNANSKKRPQTPAT
ncbi:hypothetical protein K435DRAFT_648606 [Dendrothele bispora CBS 962.96]|uniref:Chromatin-remodeling ATPase INO80 n=1 Tax=Dendrothele bispora (strain CBS 962.96) TaxID=1314807 RepID=A0A4V4HI13_DENBC|nr:hypothetical protein K435DRAFT_648606 [Dendrothele bispora CBS 962.96]